MNKDDILKKILLNMNYDSKKTLSENKILLNMNHDSKKTLSENKNKIFLNEQTIPEPFNKIYGAMPETIITEEGLGCAWLGFCNGGGGTFYLKENVIYQNLFKDGWDYKYWVPNDGSPVWIRAKVSDRVNKVQPEDEYGLWYNYDWETGLIGPDCGNEKCKNLWTKINTLMEYVRKEFTKEYYRWINIKNSYKNLDKNKFIEYGNEDFKFTYVWALQEKLNQLALLNGDLTIYPDGKFGSKTLERLQKYVGADLKGATLKQLEKLTGKEIYIGYFEMVGELKSKGWKNTGCLYSMDGWGYDDDPFYIPGKGIPLCSSKAEHKQQAAYLEINDINNIMSGYVNRAFGCQWITIKAGSNGNYVESYSTTLFKQLRETQWFVASKARSSEELAIALRRPYFTYFALADFYFKQANITPSISFEDHKPYMASFDSSVWPNGVYSFLLAYYGTDDRTFIDSQIQTFKKAIMITDCSDMDNNIGQIKLDEVTGEIYEEQSNLSALRHEILGFIEIGALALGFATGPFAPFFFGVSTAAGLADSAQYFAEGDKYMGCMMLALEIIPGGELFKIFRKGKKTARVLSTTTEVSDDVMKDIIQRGQKGLLNDDTEKAIYQAIRDDAAGVVGQTVATTVRQTIKTNIKTNLVNTFKQLGGGWSAFWKIVSFAYNSLGTVPQIVIKVGGTAYSIDQIYLAVYGRDEDRQNSDLRKAYYALKAYLGSGDGQLPEDAQAKADMEAGVKLIQDTFSGNPEKLNKVVDEGLDIKYDEDDINILNYFVNQNKQNVKTAETKKSEVYKTDKDVYKQAPTMEDVKTKNYYLGWGMSGDSITELKKMLSDNWGEYLDQTKLNNTLKNNLFDDDLWDLIFYFQSNIMPNILGIKETNEDMGNVGNQTLSYLKQTKISSLAPKTTEEVLMDEKDFDFFYYNIRTKKWQPITKQEYFDFKKTGVNVKYEKKSLQEPIPFSGTVKVPKKTIFGKIKYVDKK